MENLYHLVLKDIQLSYFNLIKLLMVIIILTYYVNLVNLMEFRKCYFKDY
jgi:hypothetical protein